MHIADLHLDAPFASCTVSERKERRDEQREALRGAVRLCKEEKVDVLLVAGDLFDGDFIREDTPAFISDCFAAIPDTRVFIAPGNHDPYHARSPYKAVKFPDNVHVFTEEKLTGYDIPELSATVYGYGFTSARIRSNPLEGFAGCDRSKINLLVAHGDLDLPSSEYCNISGADLENAAFDYAALGHIHTSFGIRKFGRTSCAYSGCLMGRGFDECGVKGAFIGEVSLAGVSVALVPVSERRYEICEIMLSGSPDDEEILSEIKEKCDGLPEKTSLRVVLGGTVERENLLSDVNLAGALSHLSYVELRDNTVFVPDISELLSEQSLRGEFCRRIKPMLEDADENTRRKAALALKYGIEALHN